MKSAFVIMTGRLLQNLLQLIVATTVYKILMVPVYAFDLIYTLYSQDMAHRKKNHVVFSFSLLLYINDANEYISYLKRPYSDLIRIFQKLFQALLAYWLQQRWDIPWRNPGIPHTYFLCARFNNDLVTVVTVGYSSLKF